MNKPSAATASGLLPCPFCLGRAARFTTGGGDHVVHCNNDECTAIAQCAGGTPEEADEHWNRRATSSERTFTVPDHLKAAHFAVADDGWIFTKHPDGHWTSCAKMSTETLAMWRKYG